MFTRLTDGKSDLSYCCKGERRRDATERNKVVRGEKEEEQAGRQTTVTSYAVSSHRITYTDAVFVLRYSLPPNADVTEFL